jgi:hypothetical protein
LANTPSTAASSKATQASPLFKASGPKPEAFLCFLLFPKQPKPLANEENFAFGANEFSIRYDDLGGTALTLEVIPEPSSAFLLGLFAGLATLQMRRRRRNA